MSVDVSTGFEQFLSKVSLTGTAVARIERSSGALTEFLVKEFDLADRDVFLQGSYPNGTAVRPVAGGEYDVDIICVMSSSAESADSALSRLESALRADGRYKSRVVPKKPCIRLDFADDDLGKFHIDVVPVRPSPSADAPLDAPRRGEGWHPTAPREYTEWCSAQGVLFERTVKVLKRWRDDQQSVRNAVKSIVLQVLIAEHMPVIEDDAARVHATLVAMHSALEGLQSAPMIRNPVLPTENLAARWTETSFKEFQAELAEARETASRALSTDDAVEAVECWRDILGDDFPAVATESLGIQLADDSHARTFGQEGWEEDLDPRYGVRITATTQRGKRSPRRHKYENNGPLIFEGHQIRFEALTRGPSDVEVWWQVANTGAHARARSGLRGDFFRARQRGGAPSPDPRVNWESTSFTGAHWVRAVLVRDNTVVAASPYFRVNIFNKSHRYAP